MHTSTCSWCKPIVVRGANHYLFVVQTNSGTGANHYSFVVQTNSGTGCKPILVHESTYIGRHRDLYSFVVGAI